MSFTAGPRNFFWQPLLSTTATGPRCVKVPCCSTLEFQNWDNGAQRCLWTRVIQRQKDQPYTPYPGFFPQEEPFLLSILPSGSVFSQWWMGTWFETLCSRFSNLLFGHLTFPTRKVVVIIIISFPLHLGKNNIRIEVIKPYLSRIYFLTNHVIFESNFTSLYVIFYNSRILKVEKLYTTPNYKKLFLFIGSRALHSPTKRIATQ